jgi:hypothetical protein
MGHHADGRDKPLGVHPIEMSHDTPQIPRGRAQKQMVVMAHQTMGENLAPPQRVNTVELSDFPVE